MTANPNSKSTVNQDPVSTCRIWTEQIVKESRLQKINETFSLNPASLECVTKKVTQIVPTKDVNLTNYPLLKDAANNDTESIRNTISKLRQTPTEKFDFPQSTNHELGWYVNHPQYAIKQAQFPGDAENKKRWHFALSQSPITRFAQHYYLTMGHTLYSKPKTDTSKPTK